MIVFVDSKGVRRSAIVVRMPVNGELDYASRWLGTLPRFARGHVASSTVISHSCIRAMTLSKRTLGVGPEPRPVPVIRFAERPSPSPYLACVWRAESTCADDFLSVTYSEWEIVVAHVDEHIQVALRGPVSIVKRTLVPGNGRWIGIRFRRGVTMAAIKNSSLLDSHFLLPSSNGKFWLAGMEWEVPTFDNAEDFIARLLREGLLGFDELVPAILRGEAVSGENLRTEQRRFLRTTGLSRRAIISIERAHAATLMLKGGSTISDTVGALGYSDQPHLTRSLRRLIGCTPGEILSQDAIQLSVIPKPDPAIIAALPNVDLEPWPRPLSTIGVSSANCRK